MTNPLVKMGLNADGNASETDAGANDTINAAQRGIATVSAWSNVRMARVSLIMLNAAAS